MNVEQLTEYAHQGQVNTLDLISIEGGIYLLEAHLRDGSQLLRSDNGKALHLRSAEHARNVLEKLPPVPFFLVHASAYDEMCGLGTAAGEPLRVPIALRPSF
ncbi:DUF6482 family protein [Pseudomonas sp. nanlin1]|uniref:DUF6482 family protein n=1 Tax=Pseudomonas sp. nanlin1 TaxID=3040605 RepID=UPI00388DE1F4